ncbi:hypothetical protein F4804DRAFT_129707 [Jackrogersella minutella]|nr:hypothetical protein F4804DRAFT_129707 [Jackrogersella minutella]
MTSITIRIKEASSHNAELLAILSETDYASPALEQQKHYIEDLNNELSTIQKRIAVLDKQRAKELKEHKKYRDSVMKRFAYRVSGKTDKFEARAEKEEQEYFAVLQQERQAKEREENIKASRSKALEASSDLEAAVDRHTEAQKQLNSLYDSIFQGPTPAFPDEDRLERDLESTSQAYREHRKLAQTESQVVDLLSDAIERLNQALIYTEEALSHSRMDMFVGGTFTDMMERNALDKAENQVNQMRFIVKQAQRISHHVQALPEFDIAQSSLMCDVFFDNIFSDMAFHEKIKDSRSALNRAGSRLLDQLALAKSRHREAEEAMNIHAVALEAARGELQKARERIFERITNTNTGEQANPADDPPPYSS